MHCCPWIQVALLPMETGCTVTHGYIGCSVAHGYRIQCCLWIQGALLPRVQARLYRIEGALLPMDTRCTVAYIDRMH